MEHALRNVGKERHMIGDREGGELAIHQFVHLPARLGWSGESNSVNDRYANKFRLGAPLVGDFLSGNSWTVK